MMNRKRPLCGFVGCLGASIGLMMVSSAAVAADQEAGQRLAQQRCAACHTVGTNPRQEIVADAPPFEVIGRKFGFDADALVMNLMGPHRKMNFSLRRTEADDIAAYIGTLKR
jgi:mono/diheme cytochrome c family protein